MLIRPAIGDTDPIRYRRPTPDGQFSGNILDEAMRPPSAIYRSPAPRSGVSGAAYDVRGRFRAPMRGQGPRRFTIISWVARTSKRLIDFNDLEETRGGVPPTVLVPIYELFRR